jgi:predicted enzyme related to lactoylglutathione lyase
LWRKIDKIERGKQSIRTETFFSGVSIMAINRTIAATVAAIFVTGASTSVTRPTLLAQSTTTSSSIAVGSQYDTTHVYVAPEDFDRFTASWTATFGGTTSKQGVFTVTPTPSSTISQLVYSPVGNLSVFGFKTPIPFPFGAERTGYLVTNLDAAIKAARAAGADILVDPFPDPIGRDVVIQWPGGVNMQLYWHTTTPNYAPLVTVPENRVYVSAHSVSALLRSFLAFSRGRVVSDEAKAPGAEIGVPNKTFRRVRVESGFGKLTVLVTDGQLPYPYGREMAGYEVADLDDTLAKATDAGAKVLVAPYVAGDGKAAMVQFPGGYIAEIHGAAGTAASK